MGAVSPARRVGPCARRTHEEHGQVEGRLARADGRHGAPRERHGGHGQAAAEQQALEGQRDHRVLQLHPAELQRRPHACAPRRLGGSAREAAWLPTALCAATASQAVCRELPCLWQQVLGRPEELSTDGCRQLEGCLAPKATSPPAVLGSSSLTACSGLTGRTQGAHR